MMGYQKVTPTNNRKETRAAATTTTKDNRVASSCMQQELHFVYHTFFWKTDDHNKSGKTTFARSSFHPKNQSKKKTRPTTQKKGRNKKLRHILDIPEKNKYTHHAFTYLIRTEEKTLLVPERTLILFQR